jgi:acyl-CoA reductase-like NAD-dependent aldehyde dehydrogenase
MAEIVPQRGIWIHGEERPGRSSKKLDVVNPHNGLTLATVSLASKDDAEDAIVSAQSTFRTQLRTMPIFERAAILRKTAEEIRKGSKELIEIVVAEAGKPIRDVTREIGRASTLLDLAADFAMVQTGQVLPMDIVESGVNRKGIATRVPVGIIVAIVPSNSPVNLTINKIGPAIAAGNAVIIKPSDQTPISALWLAAAFKRAGLPDGAINVVIGEVEEAIEPLIKDSRVRMVSITGGVPAGLAVIKAAGIKKVVLELGSSAANVVRADADVAAAGKTLATSAYLSSGQACISAQRIFVHAKVKDQFIEAFVKATEAMKIGDPMDPEVEIGPMVSQVQAQRVLGWIEEAKAAGAKVLTGGHAIGRTIAPTLLSDVPDKVTLASSEAFAPVAVLEVFTEDDDVIERVNQSIFGLQAGVFTNDLKAAFRFGDEIDAGAVWINDSSRYRQDNYPFGGMKYSGIGREGVQYAIEEMTEWKFVGFKLGASKGIL